MTTLLKTAICLFKTLVSSRQTVLLVVSLHTESKNRKYSPILSEISVAQKIAIFEKKIVCVYIYYAKY